MSGSGGVQLPIDLHPTRPQETRTDGAPEHLWLVREKELRVGHPPGLTDAGGGGSCGLRGGPRQWARSRKGRCGLRC